MILRLALREERKHYLMYLFIKIQIAVTFLVLIVCVSVITSQYGIYNGFLSLFDSGGQFVQSTLGVRVPAENVEIGQSGKAIMESHLSKAEIVSSYHLMGNFIQDGSELLWSAIAYDDELSEAYTPILEDGQWLEKRDAGAWELRAVISPNDYGIETGDEIVFAPYDEGIGNIKVKIIGKLKENSRVAAFQTSNDMVSYQNFISTYESAEGLPAIFLLKSDFTGLFRDSSVGEKLLWPAGMMFIKYNKEISDAEKRANEDFCRNYLDVRIMESLEKVKVKSRKYLKEQIMEVFPVLLAALLFSFFSTICVSALGTRYAVKNYIIYRICGLSFRRCKKIQFCLNVTVLCESLFMAFISGVVLKQFIKNQDIMLNLGFLQFGICIIGGAIWLAASYSIQKMMLRNPDYWRKNCCD